MSLTKLKNDNSGIVLVMVVMMSVVLTVVALSMLGVTISQVSTSRFLVDSMIAEQFAIGKLYKYMNQRIGGSAPLLSGFSDLNNSQFSYTIDDTDPPGVNDAQPIRVTVTFQYNVPPQPQQPTE